MFKNYHLSICFFNTVLFVAINSVSTEGKTKVMQIPEGRTFQAEGIAIAKAQWWKQEQ